MASPFILVVNTIEGTQFAVPRREFHGLWDSLVMEPGLKDRIVDFASSALQFAACGVQNHVIDSNRMVLLHGPPGCGKTTLCKALAQKLAIRMSHVYENSVLIEVHSHSLFSKWFSESGKLVARLFEHIQELVSDPKILVCVLIDEVESLTAARNLSSSEPSDAVRVVNAMLTQLDRLKRHSNVLTLCTTNLASAIDAAFIDRADIKAYLGLPPLRARYVILRECLLELMRVGLVESSTVSENPPTESPSEAESHLLAASVGSEGLSGRTLRKLPFAAHATYIQHGDWCTAVEFALALRNAVSDEIRARDVLAADGCASQQAAATAS